MITKRDLLITWVIFAIFYAIASVLLDVLLAYRDEERVNWRMSGRRVVYVVVGGAIYGWMVAITID
jgi:membrane associated rhomboid family serine protease